MKNAILMVTMVILTMTNSNAQSETTKDNRQKLSFGLKVGANYSNFYDSEGEDFVADPKFGLSGGAFVSIPLGKFFGVQPEVLFSQKGFKSTGTFLGSTYSMTITTDFIDVPLLFAVKPIEQVTLLFGPQFSYLLSQKNDFTGGTISATQQQDFDNDNIRKNIYGLTGGVDLNISNFVLGVRAAWDVKNNDGDGNSTTPRYKNMLYQATLGYRF